MSYYNKKQKCLGMLKNTILTSNEPIPLNVLKYAVLEKFGFSEKQLMDQLDLLESLGYIKHDGELYSKNEEGV